MFPVFFNNSMHTETNSVSPSSKKPALVVAEWRKKFPGKVNLCGVPAATVEDFALAHDIDFVRDTLSCTIPNGFNNKDTKVAASLPYTTGSMVTAAKYLLMSEEAGVAVSPTSGFHHAAYNRSMGFCTFNGLMVTTVKLLKEGLAKKVGILDCDFHYGNGTDDIIAKLNLDESVVHFTAGADYTSPQMAQRFMDRLPKVLEDFVGRDILLYQAGADAHKDDPFGGLLTDEQLYRRDKMVFEFCKAQKLPVVWNLAGGYQVAPDGSIQKVLDIHNNTFRAMVEVYHE
jgi:acetoin utilization deacetylase AcuC-like enzyme